ncbi:MAG: hypothetical protein MGF17_07055 [Trichodesmium sp. MAG_R04]|jgi:hypothetical protein|nr:hypothetical protein [Trichodesmium sp. MAG_R04]
MERDPAVLKKVSVSLPFGLGCAEWEADQTERYAAWSLYVELVTRISVQPLGQEEGILREALDSLYRLFDTTREILKEAGPGVGASQNSVGGIAITVLNQGLRPFLTKWHSSLEVWETQRSNGVSPKEHEKEWSEESKMRGELEYLRQELNKYALGLAKISGVEKGK